MVSRKEKIREIVTLFEKEGLQTPLLDAILLMAFAEKTTQNDVRLHHDLPVENEKTLNDCVQRRLLREPVAKIIQSKGFWKFDFYVNSDVLDPRADSETIVQAVLDFSSLKNSKKRILDLGTGSGCLILSVLKEALFATGVGVDKSEKALKVAEENAKRLGLEKRFQSLHADWNDDGFVHLFHEKFDIVLCNPPYIASNEILSKETLFDPKQALFAEENGLHDYRILSEKLNDLLTDDGMAFFELGAGQKKPVKDFFEQNGFKTVCVKKDFGKIDRCLVLQHKKKNISEKIY